LTAPGPSQTQKPRSCNSSPRLDKAKKLGIFSNEIHNEANSGPVMMTAQKSMRHIQTEDDIKELVKQAFPIDRKVPNAEHFGN